MAIAVERTSSEGVDVLQVRGEVDVLTSPALADELARSAGTEGPRVVVDLTGVEFLDSTGLGVLVNARKQIATAGGRLAIVCTSARITKLFSITGLEDVFDLYSDVDSARTAVSG